MSRRGWLFFLALGAIWGLPYLLIRISVREVSPAFLVFVRTGGGALLLAPFVVRRGALRPLLAHWKPLVAYSVAEIAIPWWLLFTAEKRVTSSLAGLLVAAVPIAGAVIARVKGPTISTGAGLPASPWVWPASEAWSGLASAARACSLPVRS